jgi:hypothetical protein
LTRIRQRHRISAYPVDRFSVLLIVRPQPRRRDRADRSEHGHLDDPWPDRRARARSRAAVDTRRPACPQPGYPAAWLDR